MKWIVGAGSHGYWLGSYEYDKQRFFADMVEFGSIVYDIGANAGFYTLLSSVLVGPPGKVYAFEPVSRNVQFLKEHLRINHVNNVEVIEAAVSDKSGTVMFESGPNIFMGHISNSGEQSVISVTLDDMVYKNKLPIPNYLKIDVEGSELLVLKGAEMIIKTTHPTVFLATHGQEIHLKCCQFLTAHGYHIRALDGNEVATTNEIIGIYG